MKTQKTNRSKIGKVLAPALIAVSALGCSDFNYSELPVNKEVTTETQRIRDYNQSVRDEKYNDLKNKFESSLERTKTNFNQYIEDGSFKLDEQRDISNRFQVVYTIKDELNTREFSEGRKPLTEISGEMKNLSNLVEKNLYGYDIGTVELERRL